MKNCLVALVISSMSFSVSAQKKELTFWFPEKFVKESAQNQTVDSFIYPVTAIINPFKKCKVIAYRSEVRPLVSKEISVNGISKFEVYHLGYAMNLEEIDSLTVEKYLNSRIYLSLVNDKLLLEVCPLNTPCEKTYFVDRIDGHRFTGYNTAMASIKKSK